MPVFQGFEELSDLCMLLPCCFVRSGMLSESNQNTRPSVREDQALPFLPSHRKVIHIILSQNTLCKRLFIHIRELLAPPNTICMCKRANFNMYRVVVSAYLYMFENSWPNRILYVCLYFRWRCTNPCRCLSLKLFFVLRLFFRRHPPGLSGAPLPLLGDQKTLPKIKKRWQKRPKKHH